MDAFGLYTRTIMELTHDPGEEFGVYGEFATEPSIGDYMGYGIWFGDDQAVVGVA